MGPYTRGVCTLWYRSPEVLLGSNAYDDKLDVWSMLCVLYEFATGKVLFDGYEQDYDQILKIFLVTGMPTEATWPGVEQLPGYQSVPSHSFKGRPAYFNKNKSICPLIQGLLDTGVVCDPNQRPSSHTLLDMVYEYLGM